MSPLFRVSFSLPVIFAVCGPLSGCSEVGVVGFQDLGPVGYEADELLEDGAAHSLGRASVRRFGEARLGLNGPSLRLHQPTEGAGFEGSPVGVGASTHRWQASPAIEIDDEVLLVAENRLIRLLLSPDPADLDDVARWGVEGGTTIDGAPSDEGGSVRFGPGHRVRVQAADAEYGTVLVGGADALLDAEAWLPSEAVGKVYDPWASGGVESWGGNDLLVRAGTELLDAPRGARLATIDPDNRSSEVWVGACAFDGSRLIEEWGDWMRVQVARRGLVVDGWTLSEDVRRVTGGCWRCGGVGFFGGLRSGPMTLAEGTPLFDAPDGRLVGRVLADHARSLAEPDDEGWIATEVATRWGVAAVWVDGLQDFAPEIAERTWETNRRRRIVIGSSGIAKVASVDREPLDLALRRE